MINNPSGFAPAKFGGWPLRQPKTTIYQSAEIGLSFRLRQNCTAIHASSTIVQKTHGAVAQLGERYVRNVEAGGSTPLRSTRFGKKSGKP